MLLTICSQPELRSALRRHAARYCLTRADQDVLIDRTVTAACDDPELLDGILVEAALSKIMDHLAQQALLKSEEIVADDRTFARA